MCTATWYHGEDGYELFFNRDELRTRKPAVAPSIQAQNGVRYIAPIDRDAGGTWIGVNQFGISVCLLNRYAESTKQATSTDYTSRGLLLVSLLDSPNLEVVNERLGQEDLRKYRPFEIVAVDRRYSPTTFAWTGVETESRESAPAQPPVTSSSYETQSVLSSRKAVYCELAQKINGIMTPDTLLSYHRSHLPKRGPYSVCMHRDDAKTVSFTRITVNSNRVSVRYAHGNPCRSKTGPPVEIPTSEP